MPGQPYSSLSLLLVAKLVCYFSYYSTALRARACVCVYVRVCGGDGCRFFVSWLTAGVIDDIFEIISNTPSHIEFKLSVSIVEIYMEKIKDLLDLSKDNLMIREDKIKGIYIQDVTEVYVASPEEIHQLIQKGNSNRSIAATNMNDQSSRSHMLFMIEVSQTNTQESSAKKGKLFLVDLAGSEKINKTGATGQTLSEAIKINMGLLELGNVINQLCENKQQHINYRNSKLTRILQESLGGNSKTTLIITLSPSIYNEQETLSTLR